MKKKTLYQTVAVKTKHGMYFVAIIPEAPKGSYKYDIISLGLQEEKKTKHLLVMTPKEAVMFGVGLIRASVLADVRIMKNFPKDTDWATNWESAFEIRDEQSTKS